MTCPEFDHGKVRSQYVKTHLYRKLILASTYEMPSSIEDNRNSRTYALKTGENRMMSYPRDRRQYRKEEKSSKRRLNPP